MFSMVYEMRDEMSRELSEVASKIVVSLSTNRQSVTFRNKAKAARPDDGRTRQQIISGGLLRELVLDTNASIDNNDALDLMHAIDAVDYCDLVFLDRAWERRVNALRHHIAEVNIEMPIAQCFSMRNDGMECFLAALERWPISPQWSNHVP